MLIKDNNYKFSNTKEGSIKAEAYDRSIGGTGFWEPHVDLATDMESIAGEVVQINPHVLETKAIAERIAELERTLK
ncbi:MAG TPA: hypothetical protein VJJ78_01335 [Candidatus Saccharimonadales bacterium]|nr:hypothetical protein [Candidatus Saccharimonadales bacterium]